MGNQQNLQNTPDSYLEDQDYKSYCKTVDPQLGEIYVYKSNSKIEFIVSKNFFFTSENALNQAIKDMEIVKQYKDDNLVKLHHYSILNQSTVCQNILKLSMQIEYYPTALSNYLKLAIRQRTAFTEECLKYILYFLVQMIKKYEDIDISINNVKVCQNTSKLKYLQIYPITKMTQQDRATLVLDEDLCLSTQQLEALKNKQKNYKPDFETKCFNIAMILISLSTLQQMRQFYNLEQFTVDIDDICDLLLLMEDAYSLEFVNTIRQLLSGVDPEQVEYWSDYEDYCIQNLKGDLKNNIDLSQVIKKQPKQEETKIQENIIHNNISERILINVQNYQNEVEEDYKISQLVQTDPTTDNQRSQDNQSQLSEKTIDQKMKMEMNNLSIERDKAKDLDELKRRAEYLIERSKKIINTK